MPNSHSTKWVLRVTAGTFIVRERLISINSKHIVAYLHMVCYGCVLYIPLERM